MKKTFTYFILSFISFSSIAQNSVKFVQANTSSVRQVNNTPVVIIPKSNNTAPNNNNAAVPAPKPKNHSKNGQHCIKRIGPCDNNQQKKVLKDPVK